MDKQQLYSLLDKYSKNETTPEEEQLLEEWYQLQSQGQKIWELNDVNGKEILKDSLLARMRSEIEESRNFKPASRVIIMQGTKKSKYWFAAASILILFAGSWFIYNSKFNSKQNQAANIQIQDEVLPGSSRATLTLSDGSIINLNDVNNGLIAQQGATTITKLSDGEVNYITAKKGGLTSGYNIMSTPRGGQYQLVLPDGSKVWLNSASSLKYPTVFDSKTRIVELVGEAYFDVKENKSMPFTVKTNKMDIAVLGTEFNINSYEDEPVVATTLINGSVRIFDSKKPVILKPGQQAILDNGNRKLQITNPDIEEVVAWKNGSFNFNKTDLKTVLRQLSRWYDVDIEYRGDIPDLEFGGELGRKLNLSQVLEILEKSEVHYKIEDRKLIVLPK